LLCQYLGNQSDIVDQIIFPFLVKAVESSNIHKKEDVVRLFVENGYGFCHSFEEFLESKCFDEEKQRQYHYEVDTSHSLYKPFCKVFNNGLKNSQLVFIWTKENKYINGYLIKINEKDEEEKKSMIQFLKDKKYFTDDLDVTF
jgi:hypothetical protein